MQYSPFDTCLQENLVYLSLEEYNSWKKEGKPVFLNDVFISNEIIPDTYYEDGIMNA